MAHLPHRAGPERVRQVRCPLDVVGEHGGGQAVVVPVCSLGHLLEALELLDGLHGTEDLLAAYPHVVFDVGKDGGLRKSTSLLVILPFDGQDPEPGFNEMTKIFNR